MPETSTTAPPKGLSLESILGGGPQLPTKAVEMPEWGPGCVAYVRALTAGEVDKWRQGMIRGYDKDGKPDLDSSGNGPKLLARALCDGNGNRLVPEDPTEITIAVAKLSALPSGPVERLVKAARALSGLDDDAGK